MVTKRKPTIEVVYEFDLTKKNEAELLDLQKALSQRLNAINLEKRAIDAARVNQSRARLLEIRNEIEKLTDEVEELIDNAPEGYELNFAMPVGSIGYVSDNQYWK